MITNPTTFAETCKTFAKSRGGRKAASKALDVPISTFNQWCDGRSAPPSEAMARLAMAQVERNATD